MGPRSQDHVPQSYLRSPHVVTCFNINGVCSRSRGVVQIQARLTFEPEKINIFNKDCLRGGKEVTCMSVSVCLSLDFRTRTRTKTGVDVGKWEEHAKHTFCHILAEQSVKKGMDSRRTPNVLMAPWWWSSV